MAANPAPTGAGSAGAGLADPLPPDVLRRLRWRARRGLLENDLLLGRFFDRHGAALDARGARALAALLETPDGTLLELLLGREEPTGALDVPEVRDLLHLIRSA
ncbi:MAG TPA: succinate dehydrogenase assembly factor 2 [Burkholderiaceae bacterium]|nr:succinate dehydrogenase assembly factor 2 [Burkholderiaceae bacterium]